MNSTRRLASLILPLLLLTVGCFGSSSSPTAPGGPGGPGGGGFTGPVGTLDVLGTGATVFGSSFEPTLVDLLEIDTARGLQYYQDDEWAVSVFFNTVNLQVTRVMAGRLTDAGDDYGWFLDAGIGVPVSGVTVEPDGSEWVVRFHHTHVPAIHGTAEPIQLHGELRSTI